MRDHFKHRLIMEQSWRTVLQNELESPSFKELQGFLDREIAQGKTIFPSVEHIFAAFNATPFRDVKVVILGQDPYHGPQQAHGLAFSVQKGMKFPPSLRNIFKEYAADLDLPIPQHGQLSSWAKRGVLLLNTVLTVEEGKPGSHAKKGWEDLTRKAILKLSEEQSDLCFVLWGDKAQAHKVSIDEKKHYILCAPHPSPLSAHRGFFGSKPFSSINAYRRAKKLESIEWDLDLDEFS